MTGFLVELYISKTSCGAIAETIERLSCAASELRDARSGLCAQSASRHETRYLLVEVLSTDDVDELSGRPS